MNKKEIKWPPFPKDWIIEVIIVKLKLLKSLKLFFIASDMTVIKIQIC